MAATIDVISDEILHNILSRLPATSFASAACVNRSWNAVCEHVLCRPKLSSACSSSSNPSLHIAVEEVVDKVLSQPIRPHFAIASVCGSFGRYDEDEEEDEEENVLEEAHKLITTALGSRVPVITNSPLGIIGRDALSDEIKIECKDYYAHGVIMLTVGFIPGMKVATIPLSIQLEEPATLMTDEFVTDIREFSASVSGSQSPAAVIMFSDLGVSMKAVMEKLDYVMSPETVIVGDICSRFQRTNDYLPAAVALVFAVDRNKPSGLGKTQFHAVLSSEMSPVGPTYKARSVHERAYITEIAARSEGSLENVNADTVLSEVYDSIGDSKLYIGVTKKRKCSNGQEKEVRCMASFAFHQVCGGDQDYFYALGGGIKNGDTFCFYHSDYFTSLYPADVMSSHMRSFNNTTTDGDTQEVFGGLIFTCGAKNLSSLTTNDISLFSDNFPGVTLGGTFCHNLVIGRPVLTPYVKESQVRCCVHLYATVYLIMSYTP